MLSRTLRHHCLPVLLPCMVAAGGVRAELIKVSPFLPPQGAAANPTANAPLEYRGSYAVGDVEMYRIVDPARKAGTFLKVGERDDNLDISVKQHDPNNDTVVVEHGGQTLTLSLHVAKVVSSGAVPQMLAPPPPVSTPNVLPAVTQTVVPNPTQADEQRRLEAVAAEVARRRALREQAAQQQAQQAGGQPGGMNQTRQGMQQQQLQQGRRN